MKNLTACLVFTLGVLGFSNALPTTDEASAAALARRCNTESYGENGGTTYINGDCSGYTFSGTNVVDLDTSTSGIPSARKRDCSTQTIGDTTYTSGDCSGSTFTGKVVDADVSNRTADGTRMAKRNFPWTVYPSECQSIFDGLENWCNVPLPQNPDSPSPPDSLLSSITKRHHRLLASTVFQKHSPAPKTSST